MPRYKNPAVAVDAIVEKDKKILLVQSVKKMFEGLVALPGGFVEYGEMVERAVEREVKEETGLNIKLLDILGVYSHPKRDPRKHVVTIVFVAAQIGSMLKPGSDISNAFWCNLNDIPKQKFAFDHAQILADYLRWRVKKGTFWSGK